MIAPAVLLALAAYLFFVGRALLRFEKTFGPNYQRRSPDRKRPMFAALMHGAKTGKQR